MLITSFYCVAGKQYFYAKICSQKRATLAMQQDDGTTRPRDYETTRPRDYETTGLRDHGTARPLDNRKTQAFSGIPRRSQSCVAVRGSLASEWCRCGASQKIVPRDSTKTYSPWHVTFWDVPQMRRYHAKYYMWVSDVKYLTSSMKLLIFCSSCLGHIINTSSVSTTI